MIVAFVIMTSLTAGCAKPAKKHEYGEFAAYVDQFKNEAKTQGLSIEDQDLVIRYGNEEEVKTKSKVNRALAICTQEQGVPTVVVDEKWWKDKLPTLDHHEDLAELVLFHELGHCILGRHHKDDIDAQNRIPASIMNSKAIPGAVYLEHRPYYTSELFGKTG